MDKPPEPRGKPRYFDFAIGTDSPVWEATHRDPTNIPTLDQLQDALDWHHITQRFEASI